MTIPCFNDRKYNKSTLYPVLESACENLEIIIVNDSSTDQHLSLLNIAIFEVYNPKFNTQFYKEKLINPKTEFGSSLLKLWTEYPSSS